MKKTLSLVLGLMMVLALAVPAMAAPLEIEYWSVFTGADGATMQGMVDAFNASQSDVKVNHAFEAGKFDGKAVDAVVKDTQKILN